MLAPTLLEQRHRSPAEQNGNLCLPRLSSSHKEAAPTPSKECKEVQDLPAPGCCSIFHWLPSWCNSEGHAIRALRDAALTKIRDRIRHRDVPAESQGSLAQLALEGVVSWSSALGPEALCRLALASPQLLETIGEDARRRLRDYPSSRCHGRLGCVRALHRAIRQRAADMPWSSATENYTVATNKYSRLVLWGRPGWLEDPGSKLMNWPVMRPTTAFLADGDGTRETPRLAAVAGSRHAVLALSVAGDLYFAQVQGGQEASIKLFPLKELIGVRVVHVATRYGQAFAVTDKGQVYAWGMRSGDLNRLDHTCSMGFSEITTLLYPKLLPCFSGPEAAIRYVSTGVSHTLFVSFSGEVFAVGRSEYGKLGLSEATANKKVVHPLKVAFPGGRKPTIIAAAAGARHSLFLAKHGRVWGCGSCSQGELAIERTADVLWTPAVLDRLKCFCTAVAAGISLSLYVCDLGKVFMTGTCSQTLQPLGRPSRAQPEAPWEIPGVKQVELVSVSMELTKFQWEHVIFQTTRGHLFAWGHFGHGEFQPASRFCHGNFCNTVVPVKGWDLGPRSRTLLCQSNLPEPSPGEVLSSTRRRI